MTKSAPSPKQLLFEQFARVAKAMASPSRLELLEALAQGERSVDALAQVSGLSVANTSHHLQVLRDNGLALSRRDGLQVFYRLSDPSIPGLLSGLRGVAERHIAEVDRIVRDHFHHRDPLTPVRREELLELIRGGEAMVIDVRPPQEYAAGHILGAVNVPLDQLSDHLEGLPQGPEIVAYCRGPYCMLAFDAVARLREAGRRARRLEDGFPEWQGDGRPVEAEPA